MPDLKHPAVLFELGRAGNNGLPVRSDPAFQDEIAQCRRWGFKIEISGERIRLVFDREQLVPQWIQTETPLTAWDSLFPEGFLQLQSTNTVAHELARKGAPGGTLIFAEEQTAGKGRQDRVWHSPAGAGLYCTLILRPKQSQQYWPLLTHVASIALVEAIKELWEQSGAPFPPDVEIKWPNDVLLGGRKCAGILLEALWDDAGNPAALVGFGVDVHPGSVPENLSSEAVCLDEIMGQKVPRRKLLVLYLKHFQICYLMFEVGRRAEVLEQWKMNSSMWNGAAIYIGKGEARREAVSCGLNALGALIVRTPDGKTETIFAEDVSVSQKPS
jgi:BirA family biotin operon repressor/biotin-[acetyl-CoA-carboxylase] ligase